MSVKRGTTPTLQIHFNTVNMDDVKKIEFIFKEQKREAARTVILKSYPDNASFDSENNVILLKFTDSETRLFTPDSTVFMDTRIILHDGTVPETSIAEFKVTPTLFEEAVT